MSNNDFDAGMHPSNMEGFQAKATNTPAGRRAPIRISWDLHSTSSEAGIIPRSAVCLNEVPMVSNQGHPYTSTATYG